MPARPPRPRPRSSLVPGGLVAAALTLPLVAQLSELEEEDDGRTPPREDLPALRMLTKGSVLRGVTIPQYDEDRVLSRVLQAATLTLRDEDTIDAEGVRIRDYDPDGTITASIDLEAATVEEQAILRSSERVSIDSEDLSASGNGLVYEIETGRGFLVGPVTARTLIDSSTSMNPTPRLPVTLATAALLAAGVAAEVATEPGLERFDAEELAGLDRIAESRAADAEAVAATTADELAGATDAAAKADAELSQFLKSAGLEAASGAKPDLSSDVARPESPPKLDKPATIRCAEGAYFDPDEGLLVFLKEVFFEDEEFKMTGADEVKVFFEKEEAEPGEEPENPEEEEAKKGLLDGGSFGKASRVVATGQIVAESKADPKSGDDDYFKVSGRQFVFDVKSRQLIVRGGRPWIISKEMQGYIDDPDGYFTVNVKTRRGSAVGTVKAFVESPKND